MAVSYTITPDINDGTMLSVGVALLNPERAVRRHLVEAVQPVPLDGVAEVPDLLGRQAERDEVVDRGRQTPPGLGRLGLLQVRHDPHPMPHGRRHALENALDHARTLRARRLPSQ